MISRPEDTNNGVIRAPRYTTESSAELQRPPRQCPFAGGLNAATGINSTQLLDTAKVVLNALNQVDVDITV